MLSFGGTAGACCVSCWVSSAPVGVDAGGCAGCAGAGGGCAAAAGASAGAAVDTGGCGNAPSPAAVVAPVAPSPAAGAGAACIDAADASGVDACTAVVDSAAPSPAAVVASAACIDAADASGVDACTAVVAPVAPSPGAGGCAAAFASVGGSGTGADAACIDAAASSSLPLPYWSHKPPPSIPFCISIPVMLSTIISTFSGNLLGSISLYSSNKFPILPIRTSIPSIKDGESSNLYEISISLSISEKFNGLCLFLSAATKALLYACIKIGSGPIPGLEPNTILFIAV